MAQNDEESLAATDFLNTAIASSSYPDVRSTITLFFTLLLNMSIVFIPFAIILLSQSRLPPVLKSILNLIVYMAPLLITIKYAIRKSNDKQGFPVKVNFSKVKTGIVPLLVLGALSTVVPLSQLSSIIPMPVSVQNAFKLTFTKDFFSIFTAVLAAPILEEILCRGIILKGLLQNYQPAKAIIVSATFFAAIHLNPWQALPAFFSGLFLGWVYYKTQSVFSGMIIHGTINAAATSFLFFPTTKKNLLDLIGLHFYLIAIVASIAVFSTACFVLNKQIIFKPMQGRDGLVT